MTNFWYTKIATNNPHVSSQNIPSSQQSHLKPPDPRDFPWFSRSWHPLKTNLSTTKTSNLPFRRKASLVTGDIWFPNHSTWRIPWLVNIFSGPWLVVVPFQQPWSRSKGWKVYPLTNQLPSGAIFQVPSPANATGPPRNESLLKVC